MSTHAKFSPSASSIWLKCGLYVNMLPWFPRTSSVAADEGTRLHEIAAKLLEDNFNVAGRPLKPYVEDDLTPIIDPVLRPYFNYICSAMDNSDNGQLFVETKVDIFEGCSGTADAAILESNALEIIDLKTGKHAVAAKDNTQLILYALGFIKAHDLPDEADVKLTIVQPRKASGSKISTHKTDVGHIKSQEIVFVKAVARAEKTPPVAMAGRHCYFCPAKLYCTEYKILAGLKTFCEE